MVKSDKAVESIVVVVSGGGGTADYIILPQILKNVCLPILLALLCNSVSRTAIIIPYSSCSLGMAGLLSCCLAK